MRITIFHAHTDMSTSQSQNPNPRSSILNPQSAGSSRDPDPDVGPPREVVIAGKHSDQTSEVLVVPARASVADI